MKKSQTQALSWGNVVLTFAQTTDVYERPGENPNQMDAEQFKLLTNAIRTQGFLQPITVRDREPDGYEVIDGHHRLRAARALNLTKVPVLVQTTVTEEDAAAETLMFNRLRGEVDLGKAAAILAQLQSADYGDLTITGFSDVEVNELLKNMAEVELPLPGNILDTPDLGGDKELPATQARRHVLRLTFDREGDRDLVTAAALQASDTVEAGILTLCRRFVAEG